MHQPNKGDDPEEKEPKKPNGKKTGTNRQAKPGPRKRYEKGRLNSGHPAKPPTIYRPRQEAKGAASVNQDANGTGNNKRPNGQKQGQSKPNYSGENKNDKGGFQPAGGKGHRGPRRGGDNQKAQQRNDNGAAILRNELRNQRRPKLDFEEPPKGRQQKRRDEGEKEEREFYFNSESGVEKWIDKQLSNRRPGESLIEALLQVSLLTCIANEIKRVPKFDVKPWRSIFKARLESLSIIQKLIELFASADLANTALLFMV